MKHHSFHKILFGKFKWDECGFSSKSEDIMEVHVGKWPKEDYDCGHCQIISDNLETHLNFCEVYEC
jgi:hypothetical protein